MNMPVERGSGLRFGVNYFLHPVDNLMDEEGLSFDLVDAAEELAGEACLEIVGELSGVKLGHDQPLVAREDFSGVAGKRVDVAEP